MKIYKFLACFSLFINGAFLSYSAMNNLTTAVVIAVINLVISFGFVAYHEGNIS